VPPWLRDLTVLAGQAWAHWLSWMMRGWRRVPGVLRGTEHQTIVLDDGRIKLDGGEPSTSLSKAAAYARGAKSANSWEYPIHRWSGISSWQETAS
jgi:hypothetical protein